MREVRPWTLKLANQDSARKTKFLQCNLHHCRAAAYNTTQFVKKMQVKFALIQEPWQVGGKICGMNSIDYKIFSNSTSGKVRSCIITHKSVNAFLLTNFTTPDVTAIKTEIMVSGRTKEVVLVSAYLPYDAAVPSADLVNIINYCENGKLDLIVGADANAHHVCWGSKDINKRGMYLLDYLQTTDLVTINRGNKPTFVIKNRQEVIDITFVSQNLLNSISNWHVSDEISMSDHMYIMFEVDAVVVTDTKVFRNPRKADWSRYSSLVESGLHKSVMPDSVEDLENLSASLTSKMKRVFEECCPVSKHRCQGNPIWWNAELAKKRKQLRKLENRARKTGSMLDWDMAKAFRNHYKYSIRDAQRERWREFCGEIETTDVTTRLSKVFSKVPNRQIPSLQLSDGSFTDNILDTTKYLLETHFPNCCIGDSVSTIYSPEGNNMGIDLANSIVSEEKLKWAISSFKPYKAPGPDCIYPIMLQNTGKLSMHNMEMIFKSSLTLAYIPESWREVRVVFIPKPGRACYSEARAYRPISLMSFFLKTLERLIDRYIRDKCCLNKLSARQHAYLAGRSVETALHNICARISKALESKQMALGTFLDIEGAFDRVQFNAIKTASGAMGIDEPIIRWVMAMLGNRQLQVELPNGSFTRAAVKQGCPQGGVLSPLLWCLVVDSLLVQLNSLGYYTLGYADDLAVIIVGKDKNTVSEVMQMALQIVESWCTANGLGVNGDKTITILFSNLRDNSLSKRPTIFGKHVQVTEEVKYLGVILDRKLTFAKHIEAKVKKATVAFWQCRRAIGTTWGLSPRVVHWIYVTMIRPSLTFACVVWWKRTKLITVDKVLQSVQRLACLGITGCTRSAPTVALEAFLNLAPLSLYIEGEAIITALRMQDVNEWKIGVNAGHITAVEKSSFFNMETSKMMGERIKPSFNFDTLFEVNIPTREEWKNSESSLLNDYCDHVFTDGSKIDEQSGAGVFTSEHRLSIPLGKHCTVFQTEVYAISAAAHLLLQSENTGKPVKILSDSQAAVRALWSNRTISNNVADCRKILGELSRNRQVTLTWIPGHCNFMGNEEADKLARKGSVTKMIGPEPAMGIASSTRRTAVLDRVHKEHLKRWQNFTIGRQARELFAEPCRKAEEFFLRNSKIRTRNLTKILSGHCLRKHLHKIGVIDSPLCRGCGEKEETVKHFLGECPSLSWKRLHTLGELFLTSKKIRDSSLDDISTFVERAGWLSG